MRPKLWAGSAQLVAAIRARLHGRDGQGMVEYAFIVMLIATALILIVAVLGHQTNKLYSNVSNAFPQ